LGLKKDKELTKMINVETCLIQKSCKNPWDPCFGCFGTPLVLHTHGIKGI
jgi:hypothetical protein